MNVQLLKTFITAAKHENFHKTAEELFLTQPAITKHIRRLEEEMKIELFERKGKSIALTEAGHYLLPIAKKMAAQYDKGLAEFELWKQGYNRKLVIAAAPQIASSVLPAILRNFMDGNSDIEVLINVINSYKIGEEISSGRAEVGLTRIEPTISGVACQVIHEDPVILVGPAEEKEQLFNEEGMLKKYRLITHNHPAYWDSLLNNIRSVYPMVRTMQVNQMEISKKFIEKGLGVSYLPYTLVEEEIKQKKLREIQSDKIMLPTSFTYLLTKVETKEAVSFITFLKKQLIKHI
ncbi:LysR family transcriptional regulator [Niallia nealsonii]|uniref:LysR family transcriptional regulator n=1 Tax=Niallia nealsonii TaxID=115979 RepID=A0A2N0Z5P6_9BACI|nr:LysR family transcriptional regulator [Niallia nealsonii]PKG24830.1 LysR family transcriptional regulator [Niallia nealsonii]